MSSFVDRLFTAPADHDPLGVHRKGSGVSGSNGLDLGHVVAMLQDLMQAQQQMQQQMEQMRQALRTDISALRQEHGRRLDRLDDQVGTLRQEVASYHASVVGHGILISELDARMSRAEAHLGLPPLG